MIDRRGFVALTGSSLLGSSLRGKEPQFPPARAVTKGPKHHFFGYYDKTNTNHLIIMRKKT